MASNSENATTPSPLFQFLSNPRSYYPIYKRICLSLDVAGIIVHQCNKALSFIYKDLLKFQWNINGYLRSFFSDPWEFRTIQRQTNTISAGRSAMMYFDQLQLP
ncbi:hypothetical protein P154DRAFT_570369 [Amniculicola lignicola CBS 123094]|uniref:Uncharacterized protein n=1 Tax=Amniculicola lignicola CBS 123094 TaxID=1392246 RepID=A0A6A5X2R9_9PLEO|nr:hypothetical protein P154DRAFT_570369 [Amniculicola lignicola CBS 123094]